MLREGEEKLLTYTKNYYIFLKSNCILILSMEFIMKKLLIVGASLFLSIPFVASAQDIQPRAESKASPVEMTAAEMQTVVAGKNSDGEAYRLEFYNDSSKVKYVDRDSNTSSKNWVNSTPVSWDPSLN